ncbi:EVE domain-containing protein [Aeromicrobium sp.]|uniref:EVE domain-containing protein n=1 Tax=Aeromicrobium sp. TaxID=1871063 RepID=UPI00403485FC
MTSTNPRTAVLSGGDNTDILDMPTWLFQYSPRSAKDLQNGWEAGAELDYPALDRHADEIKMDDFVLFWVSGPAKEAGIIGWGLASGHLEERDHAKNYHDPDGPRSLRASLEVNLCSVFDRPIITREELKQHPVFEDFDLFAMPNRSNAFTVTAEQWAVIFARIDQKLAA